jgi:hypothetical protein
MARRARDKAARLQRHAELLDRGSQGERATAEVLRRLPGEWHVLHDVRWPGRARANLDHVVIGPGGVFVVDTKNWSGRVSLSDGTLRQNGYSREPAVAGAAEAALAVMRLTGQHGRHVHPVLCFVAQPEMSGWARDVMVCSSDNLLTMLLGRPVVLGPTEVERLWDALSVLLAPATSASTPVRRSARTSRGARPVRVPRSTAKRRKRRPSLTRFLVGVAATIAMVTVGPEVLPQVADRFAKVVVTQVESPATCDSSPSESPTRPC